MASTEINENQNDLEANVICVHVERSIKKLAPGDCGDIRDVMYRLVAHDLTKLPTPRGLLWGRNFSVELDVE
jgi:hypothetical protein